MWVVGDSSRKEDQRIGFDVEICGIMERAARMANPQLRSSIEHAHHL